MDGSKKFNKPNEKKKILFNILMDQCSKNEYSKKWRG
jgi:hypothetical protein